MKIPLSRVNAVRAAAVVAGLTLTGVATYQVSTAKHAAPGLADRMQATSDLLNAVRDIPTKHGTSDPRSLALVSDALQRGADPDAHYGNSPAPAAAAYRWVARQLPGGLPGGEDTTLEYKDRWPILMRAAELGNVSIVQMLLTAGAKVDAKCDGGATALFVSTHSQSIAVTQLLLSHGADPNMKGHTGSGYSGDGDPDTYVLQEAKMSPKTIQLLIEHGADPRRMTHGETVAVYERKMNERIEAMMHKEMTTHPTTLSRARIMDVERRISESLALMDAASARAKS